MNKLITRSVRCGLAAAAAMLSMPAAEAQQAPAVMAPAAAGSLEEVLVTARRREESMQDVPIAVSAFSADELRMLQAEDLAGLQGSVPNLNLVQGRGSANSANIYIRGIGQPDALQTFDPGVGVYLDDVYHRAHPGRAVQPVRRAARRGAARSAGHALRQEHDRGRHQADLEEAAARNWPARPSSAMATTISFRPRATSADRSPTTSVPASPACT